MMGGLEQVKEAVAAALEAAGVPARMSFAPGWARGYTGPVAAVGLRTGESRVASMGGYMGVQTDPETLTEREIYGMRLELTLSLDLYGPPSEGTAGCDGALERLHEAMLHGLPSGLRPRELKWEEAVWDADTGMFLRRGSLTCTAFFAASAAEDGAVLTDFILRGDMKR